MATVLESKPSSFRSIAAFERRLEHQLVPAFELEQPDGQVRRFAASLEAGIDHCAPVDFRITAKTKKGDDALSSLDEFNTAVAYVAGDIDFDGNFLSAFRLRQYFVDRHPLRNLFRFVRPMFAGQSTQNKDLVPKHYNFGNEFYFTFLDKQFRLYSQAVFESETESLEDAARNKLDYICDVCRIGPGTEVLDIGAGWGSLSFYAAERGANITMLTVSTEQKKFLEAELQNRPGSDRMKVILEDIYAFKPDQKFDAISLLGVMEHLPDYERLLKHFERLLNDDGRVFMDFSAIREKFGISTFTYSNVFEGNGSPVYMPGLIDAANELAFEIVEVKNDRHSYFLTVKNWAQNLEANKSALAESFGESTVRLFQLYLWATAYSLGFSEQLQAYRIVLQKSRGNPSSCVGL